MNDASAHKVLRDDAWERGQHWWDVLFYILLTLSLFFALLERPWTALDGLSVVLTFGWAAWHFVLVVRSGHPRYNFNRLLLYFAGMLPLWFALVWIDRAFFIVLSILFARAYGLLPLR